MSHPANDKIIDNMRDAFGECGNIWYKCTCGKCLPDEMFEYDDLEIDDSEEE